MGTVDSKYKVIPGSVEGEVVREGGDPSAKHEGVGKKEIDELTADPNVKGTKRKRQIGVSAEKIKKTDDMEFKVIPKSDEAKAQIVAALRTNALFLNMDEKQMTAIVDAMERTVIPANNYACKVGQQANHFYTIEAGTLSVTIPYVDSAGNEIMKFVRHLGPGSAFGEAFLFNVKRTASCQAQEETVIWGISRDAFRKVLKKLVQTEHRKMIKFLDANLTFMKELKDDDLHHLLKAIEILKYPKDAEIIKEGDGGSGLYIVYDGEVSVIISSLVRTGLHTLGSVIEGPGNEEDDEDVTMDESGGDGGIPTPSRIDVFSGELVITMPERRESEHGQMIAMKMSMIAEQRMKKADVEYTEVKRIGVAGFFGERSMLTDEPAIATVKACRDNTTVLKIDKFFFMRYLSHIPSISERCRNEYGKLVLKSVPVLKDLNAAQRDLIKSLLTTRWYSKGESIIRQGDESRTFFILASGEVRIEQTFKMKRDEDWIPEVGTIKNRKDYTSDTGEEMMEVLVLLGKLYQGQYFGEKGLSESTGRNASIIADTEVYCFCLTRESFQKLLELRGEETLPLPSLTEQADIASFTDFKHKENKLGNSELKDAKITDFIAAPEVLGAGAFGEVKMVRSKLNNKIYAAKIIQKRNMEESGNPVLHADLIIQEISILTEMEPSPFVLKLHTAFKDRSAMYLITDLVDGLELYQMMQENGDTMDTAAHRFYAANVVIMLEHLHKQSIVYRDLKPENLIVDSDGYLKMIDFGFARRIKNRTWTFCGSPDYIAPEILTCVGHDLMVDWWSFGVLLYEIVTGSTPFHDEKHDNPYQTYSNIIMGTVVGKSRTKLEGDPTCSDLLQNILKRDRTQRLPFHGVDAVKEHPWFKGFDWDALKKKTMKPFWAPGKTLTKRITTRFKESLWVPLQLEANVDNKDPDWFDAIEWNITS